MIAGQWRSSASALSSKPRICSCATRHDGRGLQEITAFQPHTCCCLRLLLLKSVHGSGPMQLAGFMQLSCQTAVCSLVNMPLAPRPAVFCGPACSAPR